MQQCLHPPGSESPAQAAEGKAGSYANSNTDELLVLLGLDGAFEDGMRLLHDQPSSTNSITL